MIIIDIDGFADAITNFTSGMLNAVSEISRAVFSNPWIWIPMTLTLFSSIAVSTYFIFKKAKRKEGDNNV